MKGIRVYYILLVIASVLAASFSFIPGVSPTLRKGILVFWLLGPPIYFFLEYYFRENKLTSDERARFKDMQDRAAPIWLGVSAALAALYFDGPHVQEP